MKLARYMGDGVVEVVDEAKPACPEGGLLIRTEASGLCSGELMSWYMDRKIPHVLGHEVAGTIVESNDLRFPVGRRIFAHHHAPCLKCAECQNGRHVHCPQWSRTKLIPGGMAEFFAVSAENLNDAFLVDDLRAVDAALIEPLACVMKSLRLAGIETLANETSGQSCAVIGLGVMGLIHALLLNNGTRGYDLNPNRRTWASSLGVSAHDPEDSATADVIFVCPGSQAAFDFALRIAKPEGKIVMFAPLGPGACLAVPQEAYFRDVSIIHSYSCGPLDTRMAADLLRAKRLHAEQVVSDFIGIDELPTAYGKMKRSEILKPMVVFDTL